MPQNPRQPKPTSTAVCVKLDPALHSRIRFQVQQNDTDISKWTRKAIREKIARDSQAGAPA